MAGLQKRKIEEIIKIIAKKHFTKYHRGGGRLNNAPLVRNPCLNPYNKWMLPYIAKGLC